MLVTALAPHVGYDTAAAIAKQAHRDGSTLREAALASGAVTDEDYDRWVDPAAMTRPDCPERRTRRMTGYVEPPIAVRRRRPSSGRWSASAPRSPTSARDSPRSSSQHRVGASELTIGGLLKHLAYMEDINFTRELAGPAPARPWSGLPVRGPRRARVALGADDAPDTLYALWDDAVAGRAAAVLDAVRDGGMDRVREPSPGNRFSLRRLLVDFIEEYGRHTGHADLIRESIDGRVGEDPPGEPRPFTLPSTSDPPDPPGRCPRPSAGCRRRAYPERMCAPPSGVPRCWPSTTSRRCWPSSTGSSRRWGTCSRTSR